MKGILLAGGLGTRLYPLTKLTSKQLLPIYDKPMIYYSLSVLMLAGIRNILIITTPHHQENYFNLLGDGSKLGISLSYAVQKEPRGIADAFNVGSEFIGTSTVALMLGDNILYGDGLIAELTTLTQLKYGATIFAYQVKDPMRYGVVELDANNKPIAIVEKPRRPRSNYAVTGLYYYDNNVVNMVKELKPSSRGELEITDINQIYLERDELQVNLLGRGIAWLDTGTHHSLYEASHFVQVIEARQGLKIACLEEIAYRKGFISRDQLAEIAFSIKDSEYGQYLNTIIRGYSE